MRGFDVMLKALGLQEVKDRKQLISMFKSQSIRGDILVDPSTTPWCACIINYCEREAGKKGTGRQNARSFLEYGLKVLLKDAKEGDICIFKRGTSSWQGHVTYFVKDNKDNTILCLGGNQADKVCYSNYRTDTLLGIRRP